MKILIIILTYLLSAYFLLAEINITPIQVNFNGVYADDDTIIAYGTCGSLIISSDGGNIWKKRSAFDYGTIVQILRNGNQYIAFQSAGLMSISYDNCNSWQEVYNFNDLILAAINFPGGYFIRTQKAFHILDNKFNKIASYQYISKFLGDAYFCGYKKSISFFKNELIAAIDSTILIRFDLNLQIIDTLRISSLIDCQYCDGNYQLDSDDGFIYTQVGYDLYKSSDLVNFEKSFDSLYIYLVVDSKAYSFYFPRNHNTYLSDFYLRIKIHRDSSLAIFEDNPKYHAFTGWISPKFMLVNNDRMIIVGDRNTIGIYSFQDSSLNFVSDFSIKSFFSAPDIINDSTLIFYRNEYFGKYDALIFKTTNSGITFQPALDPDNNPDYKSDVSFQNKFLIKLFDNSSKKITFLGKLGIKTDLYSCISTDSAKTFLYEKINTNLRLDSYYPRWPKISLIPNYHFTDSYLIAASNYITNSFPRIYYSNIIWFDDKFNVIASHIDSGFVVDYVFSKDTNNYLISCVSMDDTSRQIRYSEDHGNNWKSIKTYPDEDSLIFYYDLINRNRKIVVMHFYRESDSTCFFDAMDLISHAITPIYSYKIKTDDPWEGKIHAAFDSDSGIVCFAVEDTLFYTDDIYDRQNWKYILLPKGGAIKKTFKKFGDKFFARYSDDLRGDNIYWIKIPYSEMYPKPLISTFGYDFGKVDIMATSPAIQNLKIVNLSDKAVLKVHSCSGFHDPSFSAVLPVMDANNPLIITPGEYYEYQAVFKPESVKFYRDSLIFSSDAEGLDSKAVFTGEGIDTTTSVVEYEIEIEPYL